MISYWTGRDVMYENSNRLKSESFKNRPQITHYGKWISVKSNRKNRLIVPQILIRFFCFDTKDLDFRPFIGQLNIAIGQLGRFHNRIFWRSFHLREGTWNIPKSIWRRYFSHDCILANFWNAPLSNQYWFECF